MNGIGASDETGRAGNGAALFGAAGVKDPVSRIFASVLRLPPEQISDQTSPENTSQWDSLQSINLVMALEEEFAIQFGTRDIAEMKNVGLAKDLLRRKGVAGI